MLREHFARYSRILSDMYPVIKIKIQIELDREKENENHILESGQIIITGLELEELGEEGKGFLTSTHGGRGG